MERRLFWSGGSQMSTLVCLLEERSAEEMLKIILPKFLPANVEFKFIVFEGKQDLEKKLEKRIKYWIGADSYFLVMRDQDAGDCKNVKNNIKGIVDKTNKSKCTLVRIACHELESFYLGDLLAVEKGLDISGLSRQQRRSKFRLPDRLANAKEELGKITNKKYQKIAGSRNIAPLISLSSPIASLNHADCSLSLPAQ